MSIELSAIKTLDKLGYTYHGGELWKPPIGDTPEFVEIKDDQHSKTVSNRNINRFHEKAERINEITHWFDFKKVAEVMKFLGWQWRDIGVPTEQDVKSYCINTVVNVYNKTLETHQPQSHNSAGFHISSIIEDDDTISISVKFILTELDAFTPE